MRELPASPGAASPAPESYPRLLLNLGSVLLAVVALAVATSVLPAGGRSRPGVRDRAVKAAPTPVVVQAAPPEPVAEAPPAPVVKPLDRAAVAQAESALDASSRDRARAEGRLAE